MERANNKIAQSRAKKKIQRITNKAVISLEHHRNDLGQFELSLNEFKDMLLKPMIEIAVERFKMNML